ncbi:carbohydrate-binding protein, partial [Clostridium perfringens]
AGGAADAAGEARRGSPEGALAGKLAWHSNANASGSREWKEYTCELNGVAGRQDVYLVLSGAVAISEIQFA